MTIYLPDVHYAKQELARLHGIRAFLARNIAALEDAGISAKSAAAWRSIYTSRLNENVWPAIKECEAYIRSHA